MSPPGVAFEYGLINCFMGAMVFWMSVIFYFVHVRTEEALRESEERLELALRSALMGVWRWEIIENKRYYDHQACYLLGFNPKTLAVTTEEFFEVVHPDDREKVRAAHTRTLNENMPYEIGYRVIWPDMSVHYINARGRLFRDGQGRSLRINGTLWDVTARKKADEALYERNAWIETILQASPAAMYTLDTEGIVLTWNKGAEHMLGWSQEEAVGKLLPAVPEDGLEVFHANRKKILRGEPL